MSRLLTAVSFLIFLHCHYSSFGQFYNIDEGYLTYKLNNARIGNSMISSAPFLRHSMDARSGGLGNAGIASSPDANAMYFNASKLASVDSTLG
ncbi:hypothetical protein [Portibacter lacus]|uniref:Uncharacterized protein n=1 Tax=Portibacter lacus TaxID=1099794 RepID=A0AA37WFS8_9BACT|nr:hypothetical protein [Portibacter lacus]GLR18927.1 hypothetical protein GCM10007940_35430 [Portibacter lacus]